MLLRHLAAAAALAPYWCCLLAAMAPSARAQTELVARSLTAAEQAVIDSTPTFITPANHPFRMAAMVRLTAHGSADPRLVVQRRAGGDAAVYGARVAGLQSTQPPLLPTWPAESTLYAGSDRGDLSQGWATMSQRGVAYLYLQGYGAFSAEGSAAWSTTIGVPAGGSSRQLVLRLVVPPSVVDGLTDRDARALWRTRIRADLLLNGYPAWSSAASRFNQSPHINGSGVVEQRLLEHFGPPLPFPTDDDDPSSDNDSAGGTAQPSTPHTLYLDLGRLAPGSRAELSMVLRGVAFTLPRDGSANSDRCLSAPTGGYRCSRATVTLRGDAATDAPRIYLLP